MPIIKIYTTPTCPWCQKTKEFLKSKKIKFKEIDVSANKKAQREMLKKSKQLGVPVLDLDGQIIIGYDPESIRKALGKKKKSMFWL